MSSFLNGRVARSFMPDTLAVAGRELDGLFEQLFGSQSNCESGRCEGESAKRVFRSPIAVWESGGELNCDVDLPGVAKEAISMTLENGVLTIEAERPAPAWGDAKPIHSSVRYGQYQHRLNVGDKYDPENVRATYVDGVLHVVLGKKAEVQPKKIEIL